VQAIGTTLIPGTGQDVAFVTINGWTPPAGLVAVYLAGSATSLTGGSGADQLVANASAGTTLDGAGGDDTLWGQGLADTLNGGADRDILRGGAGNDVLAGGAGNDQLVGGTGADVFAYTAAAEGHDQIFDFSRAEGDRFSINYAGAPGDFAAMTVYETQGSTVLLFGTTRIDIYGVAGLAQGDFIFI